MNTPGPPKNQIENIPSELRAYNQWVAWQSVARRNGKPTKPPLDPKTGGPASVNDPSTWSDYRTALDAALRNNIGIGFVLTTNDPYCFIDFDDTRFLPNDDPNPNYKKTLDRQINIYNAFDSYSETSPGGKGCHVVVRGSVPSGRRRAFVEIYSSLRYMTVTGNVCNPKPIAERQALLSVLWHELGDDKAQSAKSYDELFAANKAHPATVTDDVVLTRLLSSRIVGVTFASLYNNRPNEEHESERDLSLCNYLVNVTRDPFQIERIWLASPQGQRAKTQRRKDYRVRTVCEAFNRAMSLVQRNGGGWMPPVTTDDVS